MLFSCNYLLEPIREIPSALFSLHYIKLVCFFPFELSLFSFSFEPNLVIGQKSYSLLTHFEFLIGLEIGRMGLEFRFNYNRTKF